MSKILTGLAGLALMGAAAMPLPASAAPQGASKVQSTDVSAQRQGRHARHYSGPRRHVGPRYRYGYRNYGYRNYGYRNYGYAEPYGYYGPPLVQFGVGPFGLRLF
jgi:hypothetical protein